MSTITLAASSGKGVQVGSVGLGLMNLSWTPNPVPDEQAFATLNAALENGSNFWNAGTFYSGSQEEMWNLALLKRYFTKYPQAADKVFLSVKGGFTPFYDLTSPNSSVAALRAELKQANDTLDGTKKIDLFEPARRDPKLSPEEIAKNLQVLQDEGLFTHIGLSEVNADTIRAAAKVATIAAVEVEFSPFSLDVVDAGILQAANELSIALIAYAPLSRGLFGGQIKSLDDIPAGDIRRHMPRYYPENFDGNLKLAQSIHRIAERENVSTPALVYAWLRRQGPNVLALPGSTRPATAKANAQAAQVKVSEAVLDELDAQIKQLAKQVSGSRYPGAAMGSVLA